MTSPFYAGMAVLIGGVLLSGCGGSGLTATTRHACLAEAAGGAVVPVKGFPVSLLEDAWRRRGGTVRLQGGVLTLSDRDRLTGRSRTLKLEVEPGAKVFRSDQCGPGALVITRLASDGGVVDGLDMQDLVFAMVDGAASETGAKTPALPADPPVSPASIEAAPIPRSPPSSAPAASLIAADPLQPPAASYVDGPQIGNCHMGQCSWSRTIARSVQAKAGGSLHRLTLLGGTGPDEDHSESRIAWAATPHQVTITCSLTHPSISSGGQIDELALNASVSEVPDVQASAYKLYAGECHPEARNLDADALARRYGYDAQRSP